MVVARTTRNDGAVPAMESIGNGGGVQHVITIGALHMHVGQAIGRCSA